MRSLSYHFLDLSILIIKLKVERLGFESAHANDHFFKGYLEAMMLTSSLAVETSKIKLGHLVLCNSFRNPAYSFEKFTITLFCILFL